MNININELSIEQMAELLTKRINEICMNEDCSEYVYPNTSEGECLHIAHVLIEKVLRHGEQLKPEMSSLDAQIRRLADLVYFQFENNKSYFDLVLDIDGYEKTYHFTLSVFVETIRYSDKCNYTFVLHVRNESSGYNIIEQQKVKTLYNIEGLNGAKVYDLYLGTKVREKLYQYLLHAFEYEFKNRLSVEAVKINGKPI